MKLTKRLIDQAVVEDGKTSYLWDSTISGFGLKLLPSGVKRYIVKYRSFGGGRMAKQRWMIIGTHGQIPFEQARQIAQQIQASVARGEDPQKDRLAMRKAPTLKDAWVKFETEELYRLKPSTIRNYKALWEISICPKLGSERVADISRADVHRVHRSLCEKPYQANRMLATLSKLMTMTEVWEWRQQGTNPCRYITKFPEEARERYLSPEELVRLGNALGQLVDDGAIWPDTANIFKLLLLTGARCGELASSEWSWIDWEKNVIALPDSKTGAKQLFLSQEALQILRIQQKTSRSPDSKYVFPGKFAGSPIHNLAKPWKRVCDAAQLENFRIHDLRHTAASIAVGQGVALPIIGRLLGHSQTQTTARYAHIDNDPALAAANIIGMAISKAIR